MNTEKNKKLLELQTRLESLLPNTYKDQNNRKGASEAIDAGIAKSIATTDDNAAKKINDILLAEPTFGHFTDNDIAKFKDLFSDGALEQAVKELSLADAGNGLIDAATDAAKKAMNGGNVVAKNATAFGTVVGATGEILPSIVGSFKESPVKTAMALMGTMAAIGAGVNAIKSPGLSNSFFAVCAVGLMVATWCYLKEVKDNPTYSSVEDTRNKTDRMVDASRAERPEIGIPGADKGIQLAT